MLTVTRDPEDELHRLVAHHKSNYGLLAPVERWTLEVVEVAVGVRPARRSCGSCSSRSPTTSPARTCSRRRSAGEALGGGGLIVAELADGRRLSSEVKAAGAEQGFSARTMQRAAADLEVVVEEETTDVRARHVLDALRLAGGSRQPPSIAGWRDPPCTA